jgi:hypothetical protein
MPQRHAVTVELHGERPPAPEHARALVEHWLERNDPHANHNAHTKGFSITPLTAVAHERFTFEIGVVDDSLLPALLAGAEAGQRWVRLGKMYGRTLPDGFMPTTLLDSASWEEILNDSEPLERCPLWFLSPTTFRRADDYLPNPVPERLLGSYRARWREFSPATLPFVDFKSLRIHMTDQRLGRQSVLLRKPSSTNPLHRVAVPGFVGSLTLDFSDNGPADRRSLAALTRLAPFCGTGANTLLGMGVTRCEQC